MSTEITSKDQAKKYVEELDSMKAEFSQQLADSAEYEKPSEEPLISNSTPPEVKEHFRESRASRMAKMKKAGQQSSD